MVHSNTGAANSSVLVLFYSFTVWWCHSLSSAYAYAYWRGICQESVLEGKEMCYIKHNYVKNFATELVLFAI